MTTARLRGLPLADSASARLASILRASVPGVIAARAGDASFDSFLHSLLVDFDYRSDGWQAISKLESGSTSPVTTTVRAVPPSPIYKPAGPAFKTQSSKWRSG